jgi:catechol 2,3-dioxygenase-like lactoylglutathione lyase family enzyme
VLVSHSSQDGAVPTIFGRPLVHIGYSVDNIEKAVEFLAGAFGAGPFFLMENIRIPSLKNANGPIDWHHQAAFGQCGNVNIELQETFTLEPADAFGATYQRRNQFNHVAYIVEDLAQESRRLEAMGLPLLFEGENGPHVSALYDAPLLGHTIEIHEDFDLFRMFRKVMLDAADGWDGKDALRPAPSELGETLGNAAS